MIAVIESPFTYLDHSKNVYTLVKDNSPVNSFIAIFNINLTFFPTDLITFLAGNTAINCSFNSNANRTTDFQYNGIGRVCFNKGTELVYSAGNWDGQNSDINGNQFWITWADTQVADVYALTAGALSTPFIDATYSVSNPKFVDFFLLDSAPDGSRGTSFAAPRLTGAVATIKEAHPEYNMSQVMTTLMDNQIPFWSYKYNWIEEAILNITTTTENIPQVLQENMYEVFLGRHADLFELANPQTLPWFISHADWTKQEAPLQQQIEGLYHIFLNRDGSDSEIDACIQYAQHESWKQFCIDWVNFYKVVI
jgi:hypothetical protein